MFRAEPQPKLLFAESYPHVVFGQQRTLLSLLQLAKQTVNGPPCVAVPGPGPFVDKAVRIGAQPVMLPYPSLLARYGGAVYRYRGLQRAALLGQAATYVARGRRMLRRLRPAGVFCNDMRGLLTVGVAARTLGIPVLIWDKLDRPHGRLDCLQLPLCNEIAFISEAVKTKFPAWQLRRYRDRLHTVPNGADLARFDRGVPNREALGLLPTDVAVGIVGTVTQRKGHDRLLRLVPELVDRVPDALVLVVGEGAGPDDDAFAVQLPNRDHPRVRFLGMRDDMPNVMHALDLLVVPSRHEGMGQVVAEAMACRKPVVGARVGGIPEVIVDGETGILFDGDDSRQLLDALVALCRDPERRRRMGDAGRRRVEQHFDRRIQMQKILDLFLLTIENHGRRR